MENDFRFTVLDWSIVTPDCNNKSAWMTWANDPDVDQQNLPISSPRDPSPLPSTLRRRLRSAGLLAAEAILGMQKISTETRYIFASRHGEFRRNLSLIQNLVRDEELSPADFSLSVHNAIAGLISIANANHAGHTALAAGSDSFCAGLLEACLAMQATPNADVVMIFYDEPLPEPYSKFHDPRESSIAIALHLGAGQSPTNERFGFSWQPKVTQKKESQSQARLFIDFFLRREKDLKIEGQRNTWRLARV